LRDIKANAGDENFLPFHCLAVQDDFVRTRLSEGISGKLKKPDKFYFLLWNRKKVVRYFLLLLRMT
jgi:hypothetical protein